MIPVAHHESIYDLPPEIGSAIQRAALNSAMAMKLDGGCDGISIRQHHAPTATRCWTEVAWVSRPEHEHV